MKQLLLAITNVLLIGCVTQSRLYDMVPVPDAATDQELFYLDGGVYLLSAKDNSGLAVAGVSDGSDLALDIILFNYSEETVPFDPSSIKLIAINVVETENRAYNIRTKQTDQTRIVQAYDPRQYISIVKTRSQNNINRQRLAYGLRAAGASMRSQTRSGSITTSDGMFITYTERERDHSLVDSILEEERIQTSTSHREQSSYLNSLDQSLMKRNSILPGKGIDGVVVLEMINALQHTLVIPFMGEEHRIDISFKQIH